MSRSNINRQLLHCPAKAIHGCSRAVPDTYTQGRVRVNVRMHTPEPEQAPPTELECLQAEVAQMRIEAQEDEDTIAELRKRLAEYE